MLLEWTENMTSLGADIYIFLRPKFLLGFIMSKKQKNPEGFHRKSIYRVNFGKFH